MINLSIFGFVFVMLAVLMIGAGPFLVWWLVKTLKEGANVEKRPEGPPKDDAVAEIKRIKAEEKNLEGF